MQKFIHILGLRRRGQCTLRNLDHGFGMLSHAYWKFSRGRWASCRPGVAQRVVARATCRRLRLYSRKATDGDWQQLGCDASLADKAASGCHALAFADVMVQLCQCRAVTPRAISTDVLRL